MNCLAVIPARGGSKGVPGKNLRPIGGKPLVAWSILAACESEMTTKVVVSTDDEEIAAVARDFGAEVPFMRPADLATDSAPTEPVIAHALDWYGAKGESFDLVTLLQPTSPFRRPGIVDAAIDQLLASNADSLLGVCANHHFFWRENEGAEALYDFRNRPRRQDILPHDRWYRETGSIYVSRVEAFRASKNRLSGKITMFQMAEEEGWEIDSEADFAVMEGLFSWRGRLEPQER
jgi:CMP-N,N'-diacetyllegionaminic acid synthase